MKGFNMKEKIILSLSVLFIIGIMIISKNNKNVTSDLSVVKQSQIHMIDNYSKEHIDNVIINETVDEISDEKAISSPINSSNSNTCSLNINETDALTFSNAFKYYRSCLNQNENFSWRGKAYTTNLNIEKEIHFADSLKENKSDQEISEID
tara:strand:- start:667 stop:1119 length:453 start_codon:yes stop_codon:yes gene_type:complete